MGRALYLTLRAALYGAYYWGDVVVLTGGVALQNTPEIERIAVQDYSCEYKDGLFDELPSNAEKACRRESGESFPLLGATPAGRLYGGLHLLLGPVVVSFRVQSRQGTRSLEPYAQSFGGDVELSWRN
jgi:hypothetical protein